MGPVAPVAVPSLSATPPVLLEILDRQPGRLAVRKPPLSRRWSPEELADAIDRLRGRTSAGRHKGGRPIRVPPYLAGRLANFQLDLGHGSHPRRFPRKRSMPGAIVGS